MEYNNLECLLGETGIGIEPEEKKREAGVRRAKREAGKRTWSSYCVQNAF